MGSTRRSEVLACAALAVLTPWLAAAQAEGGFRGARFGMTEQEILKTLPGKAARLAQSQKLADGSVVSLRMDDEVIGATAFRVRLVFDHAGRLAAVSLRTDPARYFGPEVFEATREAVAERLGPAAESSADDNFVDMRQVTWHAGGTRVDVKYVPGVVVVLHTPDPAGAPAGR
jgi:hypothetical protein